jgi:hypothetical protein
MSNQLPVVVNREQIAALRRILNKRSVISAEEIEIRQSQGPIAVHAVFVVVHNSNRDVPSKNYGISHEGKLVDMPT